MDDLISRQEAIDALGERPMVWMDSDYEIAQRNQYDMDKLAIETVPSAQPEIIRCKDCKHYKDGECTNTFWGTAEDDFCSEGERKENE